MAIKTKKKKKKKIINRKDGDQSPSFYFSYYFPFYFIFLPVSILWSNLIHQTLFATVSTDHYNTDTN